MSSSPDCHVILLQKKHIWNDLTFKVHFRCATEFVRWTNSVFLSVMSSRMGKQYYLANTYCIQDTEHEKIQI